MYTQQEAKILPLLMRRIVKMLWCGEPPIYVSVRKSGGYISMLVYFKFVTNYSPTSEYNQYLHNLGVAYGLKHIAVRVDSTGYRQIDWYDYTVFNNLLTEGKLKSFNDVHTS